jgi:hypothetical protein
MASFSSKFLKKRFAAPGKLNAIGDRVAPFVAAIDKPVQGGASVAEAVIVSGPKGNSYSLTAAQAVAAQANHGASNYGEFNSTFGEYHGVANVSARAVAGSKTNMDAYLRQLSEVVESEVASFVANGERMLLGPVGGSIGKISNKTIGADGEMSLTIAGDAMNFASGMIIQGAAADGSSSSITAHSGLGYVYGVFVDGDTNGAHLHIATSEANAIDGTPGIPTGFDDNSFLFRNGDIATSTDLSDAKIRSFQSWNTLAAATGDYKGVNRSEDSRLSGFRLSATRVNGMAVLDRMQLLATTGRSQCGATDALLFVVGPNTWQTAAQEAAAYGQVSYTKNLKIGVELLTVITCNGPAQILCSPACLESDIWLFTQKNLKLYNYDGFPALDEGDGNEILRQTTSAGYEVRWHAFTCTTVNGRPHHNGRCPSGVTA